MAPRPVPLLAIVAGLLLVTNPLWLVPHEGDVRYTYERTPLVVQNDTITYDTPDSARFAERNGLNPVDCQPRDDAHPRACAFDRHLVDHPPVTAPRTLPRSIDPEFVRVDGAYYRRISRYNQSTGTTTYAVERVPAETVLATAARDVTAFSPTDAEDLPLERRVAVSGESVTAFTRLDEADLGNVYQADGSYYTVVVTDREVVRHGLPLLQYDVPRYLLMVIGAVLGTAGGWSLRRGDVPILSHGQ